MTTYIAFLRGINVGGRTIKMAELKAAFESFGLQSVSTILQTGNVKFESDLPANELKLKIEAGLADHFNYPAKAQVLNVLKLRQIIQGSPFAGDADHHSYVIFFEDGLERQLETEARTAGLDKSVDQIQVGDGVIYWRTPKGQTLGSPFAQYLTKARYKNAHTNRNINTLVKIAD